MVSFERVRTSYHSARTWAGTEARFNPVISGRGVGKAALFAGAAVGAAVALHSPDVLAAPDGSGPALSHAFELGERALTLLGTYVAADAASDYTLYGAGTKLDHGPAINSLMGRPEGPGFWGSRTAHWGFVAAGLVAVQLPMEAIFHGLGSRLDFSGNLQDKFEFLAFNFTFIAAGVSVGLAPISRWGSMAGQRLNAFHTNVKLTLKGTLWGFAPEPMTGLAFTAAASQAGLLDLPGAKWAFGTFIPAWLAYHLVKAAWGPGEKGLSPFEREELNSDQGTV